jgi:hypothetical protein
LINDNFYFPSYYNRRSSFLKWKPPESVKVIANYHTGVCRGVEILDANSPEEIIESNMPWSPYLDADFRPAIDSDEKMAQVGER